MHPILFHLRLGNAEVPIYGYGTMLGIALIVGWYVAVRSARRDGISSNDAGLAYVAILLPSLAFARIGYAIANPAGFDGVLSALSPSRGGLLGLGAFIGGLVAAGFVARRSGIAFLRLADLATPTFLAIAAIVRVGCYLYGCDYGRLLSSHAPRFLAALGAFPRIVDPADPDVIVGSPAYLAQMADPHGALGLDARTSLPVHPTQLYEVILALAVLGFATHRLVRTERAGAVAIPCAALYALGRVAIEPFRGDTDRGFVFGASVTTIVALAVLVAAVAALTARSIRDRAARA